MGYPHFGDEYFTIIYEGEVPDMKNTTIESCVSLVAWTV